MLSPYTPIVTVTPAQIVGNQNDYAPELVPARDSLFRLASDAARTITGLAGGAQSRRRYIANIGAFTITLANENAGSAAENRIITGAGANLDVGVNQVVALLYDPTSLRWRVTGIAVGGGA